MVFVDFGTILVCPKMQDIIVNMKFDIQNNGDVNNNFLVKIVIRISWRRKRKEKFKEKDKKRREWMMEYLL